jgi:polar amino acid transport system substrate-binding protein
VSGGAAIGRRAAAIATVVALTACGSSEDIAGQRFEPATPGLLTVATSLPAPGFWDGADVDGLTGGFEYGIARLLAERFDLELEVIDVPFERLVAGDLAGADLALAQVTITDEREERLAFSVPYYADDAGAVLEAGKELTDLETAKEQRWAVQRGTVEADFLDDVVQPDDEPTLLEDAVACIDAVADGRADAALVDLSTALILTNGRSDVTTGGRFTVDGDMAVALPRDSPNVEVVDAALRALDSDGTLADLEHEFLAPVFEADPSSVPVVRTPA